MAKQRTSIYFDDEFMLMVDEWRRDQDDNPKRNEAIIRMVKETFARSGIPLTRPQHKEHKRHKRGGAPGAGT